MSLLIFNNLHGIKLLDNTINEFDFYGTVESRNWTHVIWDARGSTTSEEMKSEIESFCLLRKLDVIDTTHDLREWVESLGGTLHMVSCVTTFITIPGFVEEDTIHEFPKPIVVSNVCWGGESGDKEMLPFLKDLGIKDINVALSLYSGVPSIHTVRLLKKLFLEYDINVASMNAVYYTEPNVSIFNSFEKYVLHFKKYIHYAWVLGATRIIYGSSSSKCVHTSKKTEYEYYKYAYEIFSSTLKQIGIIAADYNIKIHLKANAKGNFIFEDTHAKDMVGLIGCDNVVSAPMRPPGPVINYEEFTLIEFPPTTIVKAKMYLEHCLGFI